MAVLVSLRVERKVLRTLCEKGALADHLWSVLRADHFGHEPYREAYTRLSKLFLKNGRIPAWEVFVDDPGLQEDTRKTLQRIDTDPLTDLTTAKDAVQVLNEQRESRLILDLLEREAAKLGKESPDAIKASFQKSLVELFRADDLNEVTWNTGAGKAARMKIRKKILKMLTPKRNRVIPTGFSAFDSVNVGIQRGTCMLMGGPTGTGKSLKSTIMGMNMAARGARVLKVVMEMTFEQEMLRVLAALAAVPAVNINNPASLSEKVREKLVDIYTLFDKRLEKAGGCFDLLVPNAGLRMEQLLTWLRSQSYDVVIIDYLGLMEGIGDTDQMWRTMGEAVRQASIYTINTNSIMCILAQVTDDGIIRYSRQIEEHAALSWMWKREEKDAEKGDKKKDPKTENTKYPRSHIIPRKSRNQKPVEFTLHINFDMMQVSCDPEMLGTPFIDVLFPQEDPIYSGVAKEKVVEKKKSVTKKLADEVEGEVGKFKSLKDRLRRHNSGRSHGSSRGSEPVREKRNGPMKPVHPSRKGHRPKMRVL